MKKATWGFSTLILSFLFTSAPAHAAWVVDWSLSTGLTGSSRISVSAVKEEVPVVVLQMKSPVDITGPVELEDSNDTVPLRVKTKGENKYLLLPASSGTVTFHNKDAAVEMKFHLQPSRVRLLMPPSCRNTGFKIKMLSKAPSVYPAILVCEGSGGQINQVLFSTMDDANWYGSQAFESGGKGERWKIFAYKDLIPLKTWDLTWGSDSQKVVAHVLVPRLAKKTPLQPKPSLQFLAGGHYVTGQIKNNDKTGKLGAIQIPVQVKFQKDGSRWFVETGYDFFIYSLNKSNGDSNSTTAFRIGGGAGLHMGSMILRGHLNFFDRSLDASTVGSSSSFEAPQIAAEFIYEKNKEPSLGAVVALAQTSSGGKYSELSAELYYQRSIFGAQTRFEISDTQLKASQTNVDITASWLSAGVSFNF